MAMDALRAMMSDAGLGHASGGGADAGGDLACDICQAEPDDNDPRDVNLPPEQRRKLTWARYSDPQRMRPEGKRCIICHNVKRKFFKSVTGKDFTQKFKKVPAFKEKVQKKRQDWIRKHLAGDKRVRNYISGCSASEDVVEQLAQERRVSAGAEKWWTVAKYERENLKRKMTSDERRKLVQKISFQGKTYDAVLVSKDDPEEFDIRHDGIERVERNHKLDDGRLVVSDRQIEDTYADAGRALQSSAPRGRLFTREDGGSPGGPGGPRLGTCDGEVDSAGT